MTNVMEMKGNKLVLPSSFCELDRDEMTYVDGGGTVTIQIGVKFTIGGFLSSTIISTMCAMATGYAVTKMSGLGAMVGGVVGAAVGFVAGILLGGFLANAINNSFQSMGLTPGTRTAWLPSFGVWIPFMGGTKSFVIDIGKFLGSALGGGLGGMAGATAGSGAGVSVSYAPA